MIRLSWSKINDYLICPMRLMHQEDGEPKSMSWTMAISEAFHKALAAWGKNEDWKQVYRDRVAEYTQRTAHVSNWNGKFTDPSDMLIQHAYAKELLDSYTSTAPKPDAVEVPLSKEIEEGLILTGRVDDMLGGVLVDWKMTTPRNAKYLSPLQAIIYAILNGGPSEFRWHVMYKTRSPYWEEIRVIETTEQDRLDRVIETVVKPVAKALKYEVFPANPTHRLCSQRYCGYWDICGGKLK